jgi:charged multivesicular body protein 5
MKRFFGAGGKQVQGPSLSEATEAMDKRGDTLDEKIRKLDQQLIQYREQLKRTRSPSVQNGIKQRAMRLMKQKRLYEQQREQMMNQSFNMEQANFGLQNMQDTVTTVSAMKDANKAMKQQFKKIDIDDVEDTMDDLEDLLEQNNEIQESLGRTYGVDVDEGDLEAELDMLGDELDFAETEEPSWASSLPATDPEPVAETPAEEPALTGM